MDSPEEKEINKDCSQCNKCESCNSKCNGECSEKCCCDSQQENDKLDCELSKLRGGCANCRPRSNIQSYNWLNDIPGDFNDFDMIEVQFKNTRKGFYRNTNNLDLKIGDIVAVEANPGHDIGKISMTGRLVKLQMKKANLRPDIEILRVFRKAKESDLERFEAAKARETDTMIRSRKIAESLHLNMKIGDVEYQGDGNKAIFYYIADERVDFRQLIKVLAETFKIRIEMKQIGARQEAGRIGGIGPCGRPLCCSGWMSNFVSVSTNAARYQDISLNPQKLAGQCAKLKCCLNFEVDTYAEASKNMPPRDIRLYTLDNTYYHFKSDIFKREITYSTDKSMPANLVTIDCDRVFEIIDLNRQGIKPEQLISLDKKPHNTKKEFGDIIDQNSLTRFDKKKKQRNNTPRQAGGNNGNNSQSRKEGNRPEQNNASKRQPAAQQNDSKERKNNDNPRSQNQKFRGNRRPKDNRSQNNIREDNKNLNKVKNEPDK